MLNVGRIKEGFVLDHIKAGQCLSLYHMLKLDQRNCTVAMILNVVSKKMGKKDILKVECGVDELNFDVLAFIDHKITVNVIKGEEIIDKMPLELPGEISGIIYCRNPRCITSIEQGLPHIFILADMDEQVYRCKYCEEKHEHR
ncbi:MAG: aspartate carbamoyltransferase regulatory subunit [Lachnospiraceae bacterium]|jgi:aspartate carbamoyltransferase regulatory subunit|nr:aspartate carbamoyltransferase regulatory subunit [Lachnospiraceae bacterium]